MRYRRDPQTGGMVSEDGSLLSPAACPRDLLVGDTWEDEQGALWRVVERGKAPGSRALVVTCVREEE